MVLAAQLMTTVEVLFGTRWVVVPAGQVTAVLTRATTPVPLPLTPLGLMKTRSLAASLFRLESTMLCAVVYCGDWKVYAGAISQLPTRFFMKKFECWKNGRSYTATSVRRWGRSRADREYSARV